MRKAISILLGVLFFVTPVAALDFEEVSFSNDGVVVYVHASADVPWEAPFAEDVTVWVSVWPAADNITWTRIASVLVTVHSAELNGGSFSLIASDAYDFSTPPEGVAHVNTSVAVTLTGGSIGLQSYFAVSVVGQYGNATDSFSYIASSAEDLLGPFSIFDSPTSPQFLLGLAMIIAFTLVIILGMWVVIRSKKRPTRVALLKE